MRSSLAIGVNGELCPDRKGIQGPLVDLRVQKLTVRNRPKFAIIGAGTAGLSTAILLARQNIHVTLFEKVKSKTKERP